MSAIAVLLLLQGVGSLAVLAVLRGRHLAFALVSGLLWGVALHGFVALGPVLLLHASGRPPFYRASWVAAGLLLVGVAGAVSLLRSGAAGRGLLRRAAIGELAVGSVLVACSAAALHWNFSVMSVDSFGYVERGLALAHLSDPRFADLAYLRAVGIFGELLHAPTRWLGVEYLYFVTPVLSVCFVATLVVAVVDAATLLGRSRGAALGVAGLGLAAVLSSYFVGFHFFYIHVNWLAAIWLLLFFHASWMALREPGGGGGWFALAGAAAFAFALTRVEGPLVLAMLLCFQALEPRDGERGRLGSALALALPAMLWCFVAAAIVGDDGRIVDYRRLLLMAAGLAASVGLAWAMRWPSLRARAVALQWAGLGALALLLAGFVLARPEHMLGRSAILAANALWGGTWGALWALLLALFFAAPLLERVPGQRPVQLGLLGYVLLVLCLGAFGAWRPKWYDSGNRMLMHIVPAAAWLLMLKAVALAPAHGDARRGGAGWIPGEDSNLD